MIVKINNIISSSSADRKVITEENSKQKNSNNTVDFFDGVIRLKGIGRTNWDEPY